MSYADQLRDLATSGAAMRQESWGETPAGAAQLGIMEAQVDRTLTFACYFSSGKTAEALQSSMLFKEIQDTTLRVNKSEANFPGLSAEGKVVRLIAANDDGSDQLIRVEEIQTSALNPEWIAGCKNKW